MKDLDTKLSKLSSLRLTPGLPLAGEAVSTLEGRFFKLQRKARSWPGRLRSDICFFHFSLSLSLYVGISFFRGPVPEWWLFGFPLTQRQMDTLKRAHQEPESSERLQRQTCETIVSCNHVCRVLAR